jgi:hypothetical protein
MAHKYKKTTKKAIGDVAVLVSKKKYKLIKIMKIILVKTHQ